MNPRRSPHSAALGPHARSERRMFFPECQDEAPIAVILSLRRISRGDPDVLFSWHGIGTDGSSCGAVSFENGEWSHDAGWHGVRSFDRLRTGSSQAANEPAGCGRATSDVCRGAFVNATASWSAAVLCCLREPDRFSTHRKTSPQRKSSFGVSFLQRALVANDVFSQVGTGLPHSTTLARLRSRSQVHAQQSPSRFGEVSSSG